MFWVIYSRKSHTTQKGLHCLKPSNQIIRWQYNFFINILSSSHVHTYFICNLHTCSYSNSPNPQDYALLKITSLFDSGADPEISVKRSFSFSRKSFSIYFPIHQNSASDLWSGEALHINCSGRIKKKLLWQDFLQKSS